MTKTLVVYYSLTGFTRRVAEELARATGAHLAEIRDRKPRHGGWGQFRAAFEAFFGLHPEIDYLGPDPANYDRVLVGGPVWVAHLASPVRTFLRHYADSCRHLDLFVTYGGHGAEAALAKVRDLLPATPDHLLIFNDGEISSGGYTNRVRAFAQSLLPEPVLH